MTYISVDDSQHMVSDSNPTFLLPTAPLSPGNRLRATDNFSLVVMTERKTWNSSVLFIESKILYNVTKQNRRSGQWQKDHALLGEMNS